MGSYNRTLAVQEFDLDLVISQYKTIYQDLLRARVKGWAARTLSPSTPGQTVREAGSESRLSRANTVLEPQEVRSQGRP